MASGSALLSSPAKKPSQEPPSPPTVPPPEPPQASHKRNDSSAGGSGSDHTDTIGPSPVLAANITASIISDEMGLDSGTAAPAGRDLRAQVHTPELQTTLPGQDLEGHRHRNGRNDQIGQQAQYSDAQRSPSTPGHIPPFDWDEFEARYEQALHDMNGEEKKLLEEFERLVNYFNAWASAASAHDDERAVKRLQTRERYVKIAEQSLGQRKQHLTEVVRAFQSALALLSQT